MTHATKTHSRTTPRTSRSRTSCSFRSAAKLGLGLLSLLSLSAGTVAHAGPVNWDGTVADWFSNPSHWVGGAYPGAGDDAVNMSTAAMTLGQSTTINSFFSNGAFTLQGGTFSGNQASAGSTLTVNNVFTDDGGGINNFTIAQGSGGSLVFTTSGGNYLSNDIVNTGVNMSASSAFVHLYGTDTFNGNINLGAGGGNGIHLDNNTTTLAVGAKGSLTGFGSVTEYNGGSTFTNSGTVNANSAGNTLALTTSNFVNNSTAEATGGGTLSLNNNTNNNAALNATGAGSVVSLSGTFTGTGNNLITASNGGQIQINGASLLGTINTSPTTALIFNTSGANSLSNTTVNGNLDLTSGGTGFVHLYGTDTVNGNINLGAGGGNGIHLDNNTTSFVLGSTGSLTGFGSVSEYNGGSVFTNNGLVNANSSGNTLNLNTSAFANTGTVQVQNGAALSVTSTNTDSGNILVKSGGTATFTQGVTQTAGLTQVDGTLNSPLTLTGGTLSGTGTVNGNAANNGGAVSAGNSASPFGTLAVNGAFSQTAGVFDVGFSSTQNNLLAVNGAVTTGGLLNVSYLGSGAYTGFGPFTFLDYSTLASSLTGTGPTQYFANETFDANGNGIIAGQNGFTYELLNNTSIDGLQLQVLQNGAPTPAVPEASTTVSMGLLLLLGGGGLLVAKRRRAAAAV